MNPQPVISFDNSECAFQYKVDSDLNIAHVVFSSIGKPWLLNLGLKITPIAIKWNLPFTKNVIRATLFDQFVGGETLEQTARVADKLEEYGVNVILDYGVEGGHNGEPGFEQSTEEFIRVINYAATQKNIPFMSIKVTGLSRFALLEKLDTSMHTGQGSLMKRYQLAIDNLPDDEKAEWQRVIDRLMRISEIAAQKNIGVLIDAEETWIQDPVDALTILMMVKFNKEKCVVYNTLQLYRHDRLQFLKDSFEAAVAKNFILGAKLVRGAYVERYGLRTSGIG